MDDYYGVFLLWPLALCIAWAIFILSFIVVEPAVARVLRVIAFIGAVIAVIFTIPGIT